MVTRKEVEAEGTTEEVQPEVEKTYSKAEYEAELGRVREEAETAKSVALKEQFNKLNEKLSRKGAELQQLRQQSTQPTSTTVQRKIVDEMARSEYADPARISQLRAELEEAERNERYQQALTYAQGEKSKLDAQIKEAGFDPEDDIFVDVDIAYDNAFYGSGDFTRAQRKLNQVLKQVKPKQEESPKRKAVDELTDEEKEELARQYLEKKGSLKTDEGGPSATHKNAQKVFAAYAKGDATDDEYRAACREIGINP